MADEIELKLELTADGADAMESSGFLPDHSKIAAQRSIYFDTADQRLAKAGLSLRIRRSGRTRVQTVKADGASAAGLFVRSEWERAVKDDIPILDDTTPIPALLGKRTSALAPAFEVKIKRRTWTLSEGEAQIEMVLDRGEAVAGDRQAPICEIELELKDGDPAALFALARRIDAVAPVRLGVQTKAERGYRLTGPIATVFKAEAVTLASDLTAAQAFQHIAQSCLRQFRLNEDALLIDRNAAALHQARVSLRRLRSAFSIFKPVIGGDESARLGDDLRWLSGELGDARNLDILLTRAKAGALYDHIAAAREAAYDRVEQAFASERSRALILDLTGWSATGNWLTATDTADHRQLPARAFAITALDHFRRKVKKDGRDLVHADDEARHEVRKDAKKLRYAAEFFTSLFDENREKRHYKQFITALEDLQDQLGALNDLATAPQILETLGVADDPGASKLLARDKRKPLLNAAADAQEAWTSARRFWR